MSFVDTHDFPVGLVLRVLDIAASTYYQWRARRTRRRIGPAEDAELLALIDEIRAQVEAVCPTGAGVWVRGHRCVNTCRERVPLSRRSTGLALALSR